jgi:hypothetical protein
MEPGFEDLARFLVRQPVEIRPVIGAKPAPQDEVGAAGDLLQGIDLHAAQLLHHF